MSLSTGEPVLISDLISIMEDETAEKDDAGASRTRIAQAMAKAIRKFVEAGQVKVIVNTTGTAAAQTGTGTGNII
ncbi:hypothetical protein [Chryseobacterium vrystaatense]|uniref:Uncharacterized protein n=1 Tax=Chryseobacterium vrystaatense TaxID=307480 RepID=A0A1M5ANQ7_9FLAO|nr:hypothetical protein [Chryseobacterium vrystaatense]KFF26805.1 hypothetical protein IW16_05825 [Chryseobacterium vrystaatense]SHF31893.1 hypothetical protein SAMN02787073_1986 [Chryseobacterium vrystaatense]